MNGADQKSQADRYEEGIALLDVGVGIFDDALRLVYCNPAFREMRRYPQELCRRGVSLEDLLHFNAERGDFGAGKTDRLVADRMNEIGASGERALEHELDRLQHAALARDTDRFDSLVAGRGGVGFLQDLPLRVRSLLRGERFDPSPAAIPRGEGRG